MQFKKFASASVALAAVAAVAAPAFAQTPPVTGPVLPGVCVFNPQRAIGTSTVGQYLNTRLGEISAQAKAELEGDANSLQTQEKALEAKHATMQAAAYQTQRAALEKTAQGYQRTAQLRNVQIQITAQQAEKQVAVAMQPIALQTFQQRGCSVLIDAQALYVFVPGADVTDAVIAGLNAKLTTLQIQMVSEQDAINAVQQQQNR